MAVLQAADALRHGDHVCAAFNSAVEQRGLVTEFLRAGLRSDDRVILLHDVVPVESVVNDLRRDGVGVDAALASGQLIFQPTEVKYPVGARFDHDPIIRGLRWAIDRAVSDGFAGLRISSESRFSRLRSLGREQLLDYEGRLQEVFADRPAGAMCQYDATRFAPDVLDEVIALHTHRLPGGGASRPSIAVLADGRGISIWGELDADSRPELQAALRELSGTSELSGDVVHVQLAGLRFVDVTCLRDLLALGRPPARIVLHNPPPILHRLLALGWPDADVELRGA